MAHSPPVALIVNPRARRVRRRYLDADPFWRRLLPAERVHVTHTLEELELAARTLRDEGVRIVATLGGDGTLQRITDAVARACGDDDMPAFLALAGGTMNGLPRALGCGGPPGQVLGAVTAALERGEVPATRQRQSLRVTDLDTGVVRVGYSFAAGLVHRAFEDFYRRSEPGLVDAVRASLLPLASAAVGGRFFRGMRLEVTVAGGTWLRGPVHSVAAGVFDAPLLWFTPFGAPLADLATFHLAATSMPPLEIAFHLWSIFRGRCRRPGIRVGPVAQALVRGDGGYLMDGEMHQPVGGVHTRLEVGPIVTFCTPVLPAPAGARPMRAPRRAWSPSATTP